MIANGREKGKRAHSLFLWNGDVLFQVETDIEGFTELWDQHGTSRRAGEPSAAQEMQVGASVTTWVICLILYASFNRSLFFLPPSARGAVEIVVLLIGWLID